MELTKIKSRSEAKEYLKNFKPSTASDAVKALTLVSLIKSAEKDIKKACYKVLSDESIEEYTDPETGLSVEKVETTKKAYNETKRMREIEKEMKKLKAELELEKARAGFEQVPGYSYYKTK